MRILFLLAVLVFTTTSGFAEEKLPFDPFDQSGVKLEVDMPADFQGKKIVLVAGSKSHGPGDHEFFAGTAILMNLLKQTPGVWPVMVRDGWPKNEKIFDNAGTIVFYMDGRGGHPVVKGDRLKLLQGHMDKGTGWVNLHYAVDYLPEHGKTVVNWMGGYYDPRISTNPHWDATIRSLPKHPITQGVKPFTIRDEWYYNMRWIGDTEDVKEVKNLTPILQALPPDNTRGTAEAKNFMGRIETMAWAYERKDTGRAFGFTGGHMHRNWGEENFRRLVTNAILWSAKIEVPETGAKVDLDLIDLNRNLDNKGKPHKKIEPPVVK
ncbi:MAG: ThuA domain-containing protein [Fimbriiglobus sp.]